MNLHGFSEDEAEEILRQERTDLVQRELERQYYTGEREPNDADGVQTMRDCQ